MDKSSLAAPHPHHSPQTRSLPCRSRRKLVREPVQQKLGSTMQGVSLQIWLATIMVTLAATPCSTPYNSWMDAAFPLTEVPSLHLALRDRSEGFQVLGETKTLKSLLRFSSQRLWPLQAERSQPKPYLNAVGAAFSGLWVLNNYRGDL